MGKSGERLMRPGPSIFRVKPSLESMLDDAGNSGAAFRIAGECDSDTAKCGGYWPGDTANHWLVAKNTRRAGAAFCLLPFRATLMRLKHA